MEEALACALKMYSQLHLSSHHAWSLLPRFPIMMDWLHRLQVPWSWLTTESNQYSIRTSEVSSLQERGRDGQQNKREGNWKLQWLIEKATELFILWDGYFETTKNLLLSPWLLSIRNKMFYVITSQGTITCALACLPPWKLWLQALHHAAPSPSGPQGSGHCTSVNSKSLSQLWGWHRVPTYHHILGSSRLGGNT